MYHIKAAACISSSGRSGRWTATSSGSLQSGWCSSALTFRFTGSSLCLSIGDSTEQMDDSSTTPLLGILTGQTLAEASLRDPSSWRTYSPKAGAEVVIFDGSTRQEKQIVQVVLIDWASKFELEALVADDDAVIDSVPIKDTVTDTTRILVIGDSISCGLGVSEGEPVAFGVLDSFPFAARRELLEDKDDSINVEIELVGSPGVNLVAPREEEAEKGHPSGMVDMFFWTSPWNKDPFVGNPSPGPTIILIELGTNDQAFNIPADRFRHALSDFIAKLLEHFNQSFRKIWLVPPFPDSDTENRELNLALPSFVPVLEERFSGVQIRVCDLVEGLTVKDTVDGVHPSLKVHTDIGRKLARFIREQL